MAAARLLLLGLCLVSAFAQAQTLRVAAAADLAPCMDALNAAFMHRHRGATVQSSLGASGNFFAQIKQGGPYDVFLSADTHYPQALITAGLAQANSLRIYARGSMVLWSAQPDFDFKKGFARITDKDITYLALANPDFAPYGRAAKEALQHAGLWKTIQDKIVLGENVAQARQFVQTGHAQLGLISQTQAVGGTYWIVPQNGYAPIEQAGVVTRHGEKNALALRYLEFLLMPQAQKIMQVHGLSAPSKAEGA